MAEGVKVTQVEFKASQPSEAARGLLGWVSCTLNGSLRLDGIAVRRTLHDRLTLSFPARTDGTGRQHFYVRPLDDASRRAIENAVFQNLGLEEVPAS